MRIAHRQRRRDGLTLLEVILASGIFVAAMTVIGQLLQLGLLASEINRSQTIGLLHVESIMAEILAGTLVIDQDSAGEQATPLAGHVGWQWRVTTEPTPRENLQCITVTVEHIDANDVVDFDVQLSRLFVRSTAAQSPADNLFEPTAAPGSDSPLTVEEMLGLAEVSQ